MRRPVFVLALLTVLLGPSVVTPRTVAACTLNPDFDAMEDMDVVFAARVTDLRIAEELWSGINHFVPVWVDFQVDTYLKGEGPEIVSALDPVSVIFDDLDAARAGDFSAAQFAGAAGACGALWDDPRGEYWVTAVDDSHGRTEISQGLIITIGNGPDDPDVLAMLQRGGVTPAVTGHGARADDGTSALPLVLGAAGLTLLTGARLAGGRR